MASVVNELSKENEIKNSLRTKLKNPDPTPEVDVSEADDLEDLDTSDLTEDDLGFMYEDEDEDDYSNYDDDEDDEDDDQDDESDFDEPDDDDKDISEELVLDSSEALETIIDNLTEANDSKQYSKVLQLLKAAVRILDEMQQSEKLLDDVSEEKNID